MTKIFVCLNMFFVGTSAAFIVAEYGTPLGHLSVLFLNGMMAYYNLKDLK